MAHNTVRSGYAELVERLNRAPQGAPPSELLNRILALLMDEREAGLLALLPIKPFTAGKAARVWKMPEAEARKILENLAGRALLVDVERRGESVYALPPPMARHLELSRRHLPKRDSTRSATCSPKPRKVVHFPPIKEQMG